VQTPALLVLHDIYYPAGWKAYVDGKETEIYKTNYAFRSVYLEPGAETVIFRFHPRTFYAGLYFSLGSLVLLLAGVGGGWLLHRREKAHESSEDAAEETA
jgi:uncharacterized membrane protein YfhO